jgi:hypothetical protein
LAFSQCVQNTVLEAIPKSTSRNLDVRFEFRHHPTERRMGPMLIGYARVSTLEQSLDLQTDALNRAGCEKLFTDKAGGARAARPGLDQALAHLRKGDTLVVWKLDRLGRSIRHLIETVGQLQERRVGFRSLQESIDTTTSGGKLISRPSPSSNATSSASGPRLASTRPGHAARRVAGLGNWTRRRLLMPNPSKR